MQECPPANRYWAFIVIRARSTMTFLSILSNSMILPAVPRFALAIPLWVVVRYRWRFGDVH